jgi:hypothetical protein
MTTVETARISHETATESHHRMIGGGRQRSRWAADQAAAVASSASASAPVVKASPSAEASSARTQLTT